MIAARFMLSPWLVPPDSNSPASNFWNSSPPVAL
jgi:hypothetical protein